MADNTYLQRLVARMGMPVAPANHAPSLVLPHAPLPPLYDPFAVAEVVDEGQAPSTTDDLPVSAETTPPSAPPVEVQIESTILPATERETLREIVSSAPEPNVVEPPPAIETSPQAMDMTPPQPAAEMDDITLPDVQEAEAVERVVYTTVEASYPELSLSHAVPDSENSGDLLPPPQPQIVERIVQDRVQEPQAEMPVMIMEPPPALDAPDPTPILETPPAQITIGDIVVEVTTQSEKSTRMPPLPRPRDVRPLAAPASRSGVRSKRSFGLGQI